MLAQSVYRVFSKDSTSLVHPGKPLHRGLRPAAKALKVTEVLCRTDAWVPQRNVAEFVAGGGPDQELPRLLVDGDARLPAPGLDGVNVHLEEGAVSALRLLKPVTRHQVAANNGNPHDAIGAFQLREDVVHLCSNALTAARRKNDVNLWQVGCMSVREVLHAGGIEGAVRLLSMDHCPTKAWGGQALECSKALRWRDGQAFWG